MTLLEVMVALAIVALVLGVAISQYNDLFNAHIKEATKRLSSTMRYLYNKAATENLTMRVVFDIEHQSYWVEATTDRFMLNVGDESSKSIKKPPKKSSQESSKESKPADGKTDNGDSQPDITVKKAEAKFGSVDSFLLRPVQLPNGVFFKDIFTEHDPGPVSSGKAYIYIFPSGYIEKSIINLRNEDDTSDYAVEVNPMTGSTKVYSEYKEPQKQ